MNKRNEKGNLPITKYVDNYAHYNNDELFIKLIPESGVDVLKCIYKLSEEDTVFRDECRNDVVLEMLHSLVQHLVFIEPLFITTKTREMWNGNICVDIGVNNNLLATEKISFKKLYLLSLLLILVECDICFPDAIAPQCQTPATAKHIGHALVIDDLWNAYKQKDRVKRLQTFCIQKTRQSMHSLDDESFRSLPVPPRVCQLLMLRDVADALCEAFQLWPECMATAAFI